MLSSQVHTLLFDLDNTLINRDQAMYKTMEHWLQLHPGHQCSLEEIMERDANGYSNRTDFCNWLLQVSGAESARQFTADTLLAFIHQQVITHLSPDTAVQQLLASLKKRFRLVLASNGSSRTQRAKLQQTGLNVFFDAKQVFISGEMEHEKPDPLFYTTILHDLAMTPTQAMMIGDHPENDIRAAQQAGLLTCWIAHDRTPSFTVMPNLVINQITAWNQ